MQAGAVGPRLNPSRGLLLVRTVVMARLLIARGASVNYVSQQAESPLRSAVESRNLELAQFYVEHGAETQQRVFDTTLLHLACERPTFDTDRDHAMIRLLADAMPIVELTQIASLWDINGRCPIHAAVAATNVGAVRALLQLAPAQTRNARTFDGETARQLLARVRNAALLVSDAGGMEVVGLARADAIAGLFE